jgi:hypothetical protein
MYFGYLQGIEDYVVVSCDGSHYYLVFIDSLGYSLNIQLLTSICMLIGFFQALLTNYELLMLEILSFF